MTPLPGAPFLHRRGSELWLEDVRLAELAAAHGTPLYVYSRGAMRAALVPYQKALAGRPHLICYAMKANSNLAVLQTFAAAGCGFDIVSGGELRRVLAIGGDPSRVVFSGVGKTAEELRFALDRGVRCFNVESESELILLSRLAASAGRRARISLRVNPDIDARTHPYISTGLRGNKFGIAHEHAVAMYRQAAALPAIEVAGIDCHIGSQITDTAPYLAALDRLLDLIEAVEREGISLAHIDLGGGLGITYGDETPPAADAVIASMLARIDARGHAHREILVEPGRSLVGNAGVLLTRVLVLKRGGERNFCIVDAAMNDLVRPAMYDAWMGITPCTLRDGQPEVWDVVGPICESGDWLGRERSLALAEGDLLAVTSAGAYAMAMASNYNSRPRAAEVLVDGAAAHVIRLREAVDSLYADERLVR
ncbi:MAG: diaminopimelate decarboxylase [Burkholderiaceae bacterium]|nr:MAG: diaminopimelate decarboxylase [Burkholderiaceae bacterium]MCC7285137.1 diaminopimelate decarboxylase [Burkholderiaceae bacterium]